MTNSPSPSFTFADLFAGIGGMRRGFEGIGGKCVFTCEWDRYAQQTYRANYPQDTHGIVGDITKLRAEEIPPHDVLLAGFPCQSFSIAGHQQGFAHEAQGTLFFDVARIIKHHRPKAFLLENVKNLVSHDQGRTFRVIHEVLTNELGYNVDFRVIDAQSFVPQHRERIFIVGFADATGFEFNTLKPPSPLTGPTLRSILHPGDGSEEAEEPYTVGKNAVVADKYTLSDHLWEYLQDSKKSHQLGGNGFSFGFVGPEDVARTLTARYYKDGAEILISKGYGAPRKLTPRECARLMGFDGAGRSRFRIPVSDMQAYKQFGNSVVVPVVEVVARHMRPHIIRLCGAA